MNGSQVADAVGRAVGSVRAYARSRRERGLAGGTHRAVQKRIASGGIPVLADGRVDFAAADLAWERSATRLGGRGAHTNGTGHPATLAEAQRQLVLLKLERERFELEREQGLWIRRDEMDRTWFELAQRTRDAILIVPRRLAAPLHLVDASVIEEAFMRELRAVLSSLSHGEDGRGETT